ncbi:zinc finger protein 671 [Bubalus bubalis]|uniref:zinc finger protein 671 n=1 Tax=Bubalus bubalis TaxID=89462 RepID=UPI001D0F5307|nr:zinc finger protein 671 [Bubalus bubalis]
MADAAPHTDSLRSIVTFEDVFIHFTREEWDLLTESQKRLYLKTMVNNFSLVMSVGLESSRYRLISPPEPESAPEVPARIGIAAAVAEHQNLTLERGLKRLGNVLSPCCT